MVYTNSVLRGQQWVTNCIAMDSTGYISIMAWEKPEPCFNNKVKVSLLYICISFICSCWTLISLLGWPILRLHRLWLPGVIRQKFGVHLGTKPIPAACGESQHSGDIHELLSVHCATNDYNGVVAVAGGCSWNSCSGCEPVQLHTIGRCSEFWAIEH